ncbi:MAG: hypothetical protein QG602_2122 [Verrucomicrobiota bacterium]|nr:hypothetical protein [Verrucomicrobiota bacterium]
MDATTTPTKMNRLTFEQMRRLHDWLERNIRIVAERGAHAHEAAAQATAALGFVVTRANVLNIAGNKPECSIQHRWPGHRPSRAAAEKPAAAVEDRLAAIESKLDRVLKQLTGPLFAGN